MLYAQLTHAIGLNDVCDGLRHHAGWLARIRGASPPSRNGFSHANKIRDAGMAEKLFWGVLQHLRAVQPRFGTGCGRKGLAYRFRRVIHVVDSTTIQLIASCMSWAKHRRRKAAAKCHLRLDLQSLLPRFALVDTARDNDNARAREVCAGIRAGEIVLFDRAYVAVAHFLQARDGTGPDGSYPTGLSGPRPLRPRPRQNLPPGPRAARDGRFLRRLSKFMKLYLHLRQGVR